MKSKVVPSFLFGGPENPGGRWDARYIMILADLLNPELSIEEAADLLQQHLDAHKYRIGELWRAAHAQSAVTQLGQKFGLNVTDRIRPRLTAIFRELLSRHKTGIGQQMKDMQAQLADLDTRFQAESVVDKMLV